MVHISEVSDEVLLALFSSLTLATSPRLPRTRAKAEWLSIAKISSWCVNLDRNIRGPAILPLRAALVVLFSFPARRLSGYRTARRTLSATRRYVVLRSLSSWPTELWASRNARVAVGSSPKTYASSASHGSVCSATSAEWRFATYVAAWATGARTAGLAH